MVEVPGGRARSASIHNAKDGKAPKKQWKRVVYKPATKKSDGNDDTGSIGETRSNGSASHGFAASDRSSVHSELSVDTQDLGRQPQEKGLSSVLTALRETVDEQKAIAVAGKQPIAQLRPSRQIPPIPTAAKSPVSEPVQESVDHTEKVMEALSIAVASAEAQQIEDERRLEDERRKREKDERMQQLQYLEEIQFERKDYAYDDDADSIYPPTIALQEESSSETEELEGCATPTPNILSMATQELYAQSMQPQPQETSSPPNQDYMEDNQPEETNEEAVRQNFPELYEAGEHDHRQEPVSGYSDDVATHGANMITLQEINLQDVKVNNLTPRQQEIADEVMLEGVHHLFNNKFMKAKAIFESQASSDPLSALGLGSMAFIKAIMSFEEADVQLAMDALAQAFTLANAQINLATPRSPITDSVRNYINTSYSYLKSPKGPLPTSPPPMAPSRIRASEAPFLPNGILRAHVVKAECCLLTATLHLAQQSLTGYLRAGVNLKQAFSSYSVVWNEYKRMGQTFNDFMDAHTISGIQFGIGSMHLLLSTLPPKLLQVVSAFGWKADKHLGFALLKLCLDGRKMRSPLASLMLMSYYTFLTSAAPQILSEDYTQAAIETLLDAQAHFPNSCFFLYFAGRTSRLAKNLPLATQSLLYASEISLSEWAEVDIQHLCDFEIAFNFAMNLNWEPAALLFDGLYRDGYWSPAFCKYAHGAVLDSMGERTDAILAYAEVPELCQRKFAGRMSYIDNYVNRKVEFFQSAGYQDLNFSLPLLEMLCIWNCFECMEKATLEQCLETVEGALKALAEREQLEYDIRIRELAPTTNPPDYFDQRAVLLLIKSALRNAAGSPKESIVHLNWILDQQDTIKSDKWVIPFALWEAGVTMWKLDKRMRARQLWESALKYSGYDFEYTLAIRIHLAVNKCEDVGVRVQPSNGHASAVENGSFKPIGVIS